MHKVRITILKTTFDSEPVSYTHLRRSVSSGSGSSTVKSEGVDTEKHRQKYITNNLFQFDGKHVNHTVIPFQDAASQ